MTNIAPIPANGASMSPAASIRVSIVAFEGISLLDLSGPLEALRVASTHPGHRSNALLYECSIVSTHGGPVMTPNGVSLATVSLRTLDGIKIDTLIVPGALNVEDVTRDKELIEWVRDRAAECR